MYTFQERKRIDLNTQIYKEMYLDIFQDFKAKQLSLIASATQKILEEFFWL